jgi:Uma2 family endonuclease
MGESAPKRATYEDLFNAPRHMIAEVINGSLELQPRPTARHAAVTTALSDELGPPFKRGRGGPGGWLIFYEPELHLSEDILVPDLAGWRKERLPGVGDEAYFELRPDWVCEVLSPRTEKRDRTSKLSIYARESVPHVWLVNPAQQTLEVLRLQESKWLSLGVHSDDDRVRAEPFDAFELELGTLWADFLPSSDGVR